MNRLRVLCFLVLSSFIGFAYAVTSHDQAYANCMAGITSAYVCVDKTINSSTAVARVSVSSGAQVGVWYYTVECLTTGYTYNATTHICEAVFTCPAATVSTTYIRHYEPNYCFPSCNAGYGLASDGICKLAPTCGATEHRNPLTMGCDLNSITCSAHQHPNSTNDACLADPPMACPAGQHDNGQYICVADTPVPCPSGTVPGYIEHTRQCVPSANPAQAKADADAAQAAADAAKATADAAQAASDAAHAAAAADPGNAELQAAAVAADQQLWDAQAAAAAAQQHADDLKNIAQQETLESVDQTLKDIKDGKGREAYINGESCATPPSCAGDAIQCAILQTTFAASCTGEEASQEMADAALGEPTNEGNGAETALASLDSGGLGVPGSCPAPHSYSVMSATLVIDYSPFCQIAEIVGYLLVITSSFISLRLLSS